MSDYLFLDKQGVVFLWPKVKELVNTKISYESRTLQQWNADRNYKSQRNVLYIYRDFKQVDGKSLFNLKMGDGTSYLIDLPFLLDDVSSQLNDHINDSIRHITQQERDFWNNKVTAYPDVLDQENLILSKI